MAFKDILIHVDSTPASALRLGLGLTLARRFGARITGLHIVPDPEVPPYFKPSAVERIAEIYRENAGEAARLAETNFREATKNADVVIAWRSISGDLTRLLAEQARFSDLLLLGQYDTENPPTISAFLLPEKVVVDAGTPILVVPTRQAFDDIGQHVLVTWDGSRESARAIHDAIPLLRTAKRVSLLAVDPDRQGHVRSGANAAEIVAHLSRHGITTAAMEFPSGAENITEVLLAHVAESGADLLVMGAYGHPRLVEFMLGGITQNLLGRVSVPVLISH